jgi:hypothetical protein
MASLWLTALEESNVKQLKTVALFAVLVMCVGAFGADAAAVAAPAAEGSVNWLTAVSRIFIDILPIVGGVLSVLLVWGAKMILTKLKLEALAANTEMLNTAATTAVHYAEEWAAKQAVKPTGSAKMDQALAVVEGIVGTPTVQQMGKEQLTKIVDAVVNKNINGPTAPVTPATPQA